MLLFSRVARSLTFKIPMLWSLTSISWRVRSSYHFLKLWGETTSSRFKQKFSSFTVATLFSPTSPKSVKKLTMKNSVILAWQESRTFTHNLSLTSTWKSWQTFRSTAMTKWWNSTKLTRAALSRRMSQKINYTKCSRASQKTKFFSTRGLSFSFLREGLLSWMISSTPPTSSTRAACFHRRSSAAKEKTTTGATKLKKSTRRE